MRLAELGEQLSPLRFSRVGAAFGMTVEKYNACPPAGD
jgi:hypothetical protein